MSDGTPTPPGRGFLGWLGRQVGHVAKAVQTDVGNPIPRTVHRTDRVEEVAHPTRPDVRLRRTVVDEVVVVRPARLPSKAE